MNDDELRSIVKEVVARRLAASQSSPGPAGSGGGSAHPSHGLLRVLPGAEMEGPCLIEPAVRCNFCGYCQSYGH